MNNIIEKIFKALEIEDTLWLDLEQSEDYLEYNTELQALNLKIKKILENEMGKEGRTLLNDQEELYYRLIILSQRYFFEKGFLLGAKSQQLEDEDIKKILNI